jgi:hypothetical protein
LLIQCKISSPAVSFRAYRALLPAVQKQQDTGMNATMRFPFNYYGLDMMYPPVSVPRNLLRSLLVFVMCICCVWVIVMQELMIVSRKMLANIL